MPDSSTCPRPRSSPQQRHTSLPFYMNYYINLATYTVSGKLIDNNEKDGGMYILPNALQASRANDWIKMTRNHLMVRNFSTTKKFPSCLMHVLQKTSIRFFKRFNFPIATYSGTCIRHLFRYGQLNKMRAWKRLTSCFWLDFYIVLWVCCTSYYYTHEGVTKLSPAVRTVVAILFPY